VDAYDLADLSPATKGLWPLKPGVGGKPLVSIVILSLDGAEMLDRLLASFEQVNTYPEVEIIVVDHGSADDTLERLRAWAGRLPVKVVARGANYSYSASNNRGARLASGELVLFLNNDIVFIEDVLGDMVSALADEAVGIVGLKQVQPALTPSGRRVYHAGVRFLWNVVERRLRPYHIRPNPLDARLAVEAAALPAVTASVLMCRRRDFLEVGGFSEAYFYGLEDVDFCCRLRWRLGKAVVCLNSRSALHHKNSTRDRDPESRRPTEKANRRILQARCGYRIRREFIASRLDDDGSFTGARFTAGIGVDAETALEASETCPAEFGLGEALRHRFGWDVRYLPRGWSGRAQDFDLYIGRPGGKRPGELIDIQPHLLSALWTDAQAISNAAGWNLLLCPDEASLVGLPPSARARALMFPRAAETSRSPDLPGPQAEARAEALHARLRSQFLALRAAIKSGPSPDAKEAALAAEIELALLQAGFRVRIDREADWHAPASVGDDVAIALPRAAHYRPWPDQISLSIGGAGEGFDAAIKPAPARRRRAGAAAAPQSVAVEVLRQIELQHAQRMAEPDPDGDEPVQAAPAAGADPEPVSTDF
jgi:GT2 family glycosyltransferase